MGALAPVYSSWIPEDDVLLKNAVEAGASLESLAKGAVQFSQRFTIQQLQERWHSLLYDPVVSKEASARMIEFEHSSPKSTSTRENGSVSGKRKPESIRKCYYSHRKRICNEPFTSTDLNYIGRPENNNDNNGNNNNNVAGTENVVFFEDPIENQYRIGDPNFDTAAADHAFPDFGAGDASTAHAFCDEDHCIEDLCIHQIPQNLEENLSLGENHCTIGKFDPVSSYFESGELEENPTAMFDQSNGNDLDFFTDCVAPFDDFACSSPLPEIPIWDTVDDICDPNFPCIGFEDEEQQISNTFILPEDSEGNNMNSSAPSSTDDFLAELKSSLLDMENEDDLLFMDDNVKDTVDRSIDSYHSLLLGCPNESETTNIPILETSVNLGRVSEEPNEKGKNCNLRKNPFSRYRSTVNPEFPELRDGVICCVLNTEDQEIPCNDDVFLLSHISSESSSPWMFHESELPTCSPVRDFYVGHKVNDYVPKMIRRDHFNPNPFLTASNIVGPQLVNRSLDDRGGNLGIQHSAVVHSSNISTGKLFPAKVDEQVKKTEIPVKGIGCNKSADIYVEKKDNGFDPSCKQDVNVVKAVIEKDEALHADVGSVEINEGRQLVVEPPIQDQEAVSPDADEDDGVPCFSDVEAMILEMDLSPDDDSSTRDEMISRYQDEETMKKIIRLECCASASMQRSLVSEDAFAVLYGRETKHFIKKPEVLLGRSTEDVIVDIDIGRHNSNKISRRQAIIKLDSGGSFYMKNLGKYSIFVNGSAVETKQTIILPSGCLIDIRGITFIFETCRRKVDEYVNKKGSQM